MLALDGLRGVAVLFVLVEHFTYNEWVRAWSPGAVGVKTFFVLSGFLITGVLLDLRVRFPPPVAARRFFARRMRRLLPAFLIAILLAWVLGLGGMKSDWPWHVAYLSNVHVWHIGTWSMAGHFWTLAVEQQFYLLWFPVVVLLPRRWLFPVVVAVLVAAPVFRSFVLAGASPFIDVLLPAQADALAAGALLALVARGDASDRFVARLTAPGVVWSVLGLLVAVLAVPAMGLPKPDVLAWIVTPSLIVLAALAVTATAVRDPARLAPLRWPVLTGLGTVSYGLYIYHYFVPQFVAAYLPGIGDAVTAPEKLARLLVWVTLSLTLAVFSWHAIEKPVLKGGGRVPARPLREKESGVL
jgi:peptidoglycan/LPS O-acetylase OafA/YrhL